MSWLGLDIGGANLKISDGEYFALSRGFSLWKKPDKLAYELRGLIADAPPCQHLAGTMTGELADCYQTKREGVRAILDAITEAADGRHTRIYLTNGKLVTPEVAGRRPEQVAAANWHALAMYARRFLEDNQTGLLLDVGSTSSDVIPFGPDGPQHTPTADTGRLASRELTYTGSQRSPICAIVSSVPYRNAQIPIAQEFFATTLDVHLILGNFAEEPSSNRTADGRPATKRHARARLARTICADSDTFNHRDAISLAQAVADAQTDQLVESLLKVWPADKPPPDVVVTGGSGEFIAQRVVGKVGWPARVISLKDQLGRQASICATAYALAVLAGESSRP